MAQTRDSDGKYSHKAETPCTCGHYKDEHDVDGVCHADECECGYYSEDD